jgi:AcrR family transcriptional regulator
MQEISDAPKIPAATSEQSAEMWVEAGLAELAEGGLERVRVEVVAHRLGVTKGGFYRRFKDRRALLDAILGAWAHGRIAVIERQTALDGQTPAERLRSIIRLFAERLNAQGMAVELAVRQAARADAAASAAVARVDQARLAQVGGLYRRLGFSAKEAEARAVLFYAFIFGQTLLLLNATAARREGIIEACGEVLTRAAPVEP